MKKRILDKIGMQIYFSILFAAIGSISVLLITKGFGIDLSKIQKAIVSFLITSTSIVFLFPRVFKLPFGKQGIWKWLRSIGVLIPSGILKHILLGILLGAVSLTGMFLGSYFTGLYEFSWSNLSLGHFIFSLTPGIWEEIMYRGVIMILLIRYYKSINKAFWIQTLIFAVCHISGFTLEAFAEVVSVFIIGLTFSFVALRTRALIAGIVYHYIHDAFLFLVQNPNGEYFGFVDNFTFYAFLWAAMLINLMLILIFTKKLNIRSSLSIFETDGVKDNFDFFDFQESQKEKAKKIERFSLIIFVVSFIFLIPECFSNGFIVKGSILTLILLASLLGFLFYKKLNQNISLILLVLNSASAWIIGHMMAEQGSERVYLIYYLIGFLYLITAFFLISIRSDFKINQ